MTTREALAKVIGALEMCVAAENDDDDAVARDVAALALSAWKSREPLREDADARLAVVTATCNSRGILDAVDAYLAAPATPEQASKQGGR